MRKYLLSLLLFVACLSNAQRAVFDNFWYKGYDVCFHANIDAATERYNPILSGFYPDPSICRRGNEYFLVNSSFSYFPGIPIFHSHNLADWKQIGHVLDRPGQLKLDGLNLSSGVYAPSIAYNERNSTFYVINTVVGGIGNFVVKTKDPFKGWSDPIRLPGVKGIDPSLFFDDDGKAYIVTSYLPDESKWYGHRAIHMYEYDLNADTVIANLGIVVDGGVDVSAKPQWLEGPHIYKVDGTYYMIMAEGGTHAGHREVAFRSNNVRGPYYPCNVNPILSQTGLDESRPDRVINVGHADMVTTPQGLWYAVFLGCRPYKDKLYNTGRETFLLPVEWKDCTPVILSAGKPVPTVIDVPHAGKDSKRDASCFPNGNFEWTDGFSSATLGHEWCMLRTPRDKWYEIRDGKIYLDAIGRTINRNENAAFLGRRQQHLRCEASVDMEFVPASERDFAGMVLYQNNKNYVAVGVTLVDGKRTMVIDNVVEGNRNRIYEGPALNDKNTLYISVVNGMCDIGVKVDSEPVAFCRDVDITHLSTHKAKGFVGSYIGMYATSDY